MELYLKKMKLINLSSFFVGIIVLLIISSAMNLSNSLSQLFLFLWCIFYVIAIVVIRVKLQQSITDILTKECNPQKYIDLMKIGIDRISDDKLVKKVSLISISTGMIEAGQIEEALSLLQRVNNFPNNKLGNSAKLYYYNNLFYVNYKRNNHELAKEFLEKMKETLNTAKKFSLDYEKNQNIYLQKLFLLNIVQGNYENAETFFVQCFERAKTVLEKVSAKLVIGEIYMNCGRIEDAKSAFNYVICSGNKSYKVEEAKQYLSRLTV